MGPNLSGSIELMTSPRGVCGTAGAACLNGTWCTGSMSNRLQRIASGARKLISMSVVKSRCLAERRSRRWLAGMLVIAGGVIAAAAYTSWPDIQMALAWRHWRAGRLAEAEAAAQSGLTTDTEREDGRLVMAR